MSIVGFNFTKINAERKGSFLGQVSIKNNISLKNLTEAKLGLTADRGAVRVSFLFSSNYEPGFATILFEGDVLLLLDQKKAKDLLDGWNKDRYMSKEVAEPLMNHILERCNLQALLMAKDLNLPSPVPMPKVTVNQEGAKPQPATKQEPKKDEKKAKKK